LKLRVRGAAPQTEENAEARLKRLREDLERREGDEKRLRDDDRPAAAAGEFDDADRVGGLSFAFVVKS
jgi:hypothetical protein